MSRTSEKADSFTESAIHRFAFPKRLETLRAAADRLAGLAAPA